MIEPINPRDMPDYFLSPRPRPCVAREVGADNSKVQMDFYHGQILLGRPGAPSSNGSRTSGTCRFPGVPGVTSTMWARSTIAISSGCWMKLNYTAGGVE